MMKMLIIKRIREYGNQRELAEITRRNNSLLWGK
ncbi:hypothetical protein [Flavobacterium micromati]